MDQNHIIKRQIIELTVPNAAAAPAIQDEVSRVYRRRIVPLIDRYCSELGQPDRLYRIDSLELDLGVLDVDDLEAQFVAKTNTALRAALAAQIERQEQDALPTKRSPKASSALELFAFFAQTGSLPWWADASRPELLAENLEELLREAPRQLRRLLADLAREERLRRRLAAQYSDEQLAQLCGLLLPAWQPSLARDMQALTAALQKTKTAAALPPSQVRQSAWSHFLEVAALGGQQYPTLAAFYRAVLERVAAELGKTLMVEIQPALQDAGGSPQFKELPKAAERQELAQRLAQLQSAGGPLAEAWAALRAFSLRLASQDQAAWLEALEDLGSEASSVDLARLLDSELAWRSLLPEELSRLVEMLRPAPAGDGDELAALLRHYASAGGPLAEIWTALQALSLRFTSQERAAWLAALNALENETLETVAEGILGFLNAGAQHGLRGLRGLRPEEHTRLIDLLRAASAPQPVADETPPDLRFSDADELAVANAGLVILWPFLTSFFTHLGLLEDKQFKDPAAGQRAVGLLQVIATPQAAFPEYLLPLNKLLCGLEPQSLFDFGPPLRRREKSECAKLLKAVIAQAPILHDMSADGFRGSFLLRAGQLSIRDGLWLLRVERQTYDIVLERFPWNWEWVKLPWMETPLRVEW